MLFLVGTPFPESVYLPRTFQGGTHKTNQINLMQTICLGLVIRSHHFPIQYTPSLWYVSIFTQINKVLSQLFISFVSRKYPFTFPNIPFAIHCNNPVRFLFAQGVWQQPLCSAQRSDLSIIKSVCDYMKKQKRKLRETKSK